MVDCINGKTTLGEYFTSFDLNSENTAMCFAQTLNGKDGLDAIYNLTLSEIKLLEQMESYIEKRCNLDMEYGEKLAKLHEKMPVKYMDPYLSRSSIEKAWRLYMSESENKAITILGQSKLLKSQTIPKLKGLLSLKSDLSSNYRYNRIHTENRFTQSVSDLDRLLDMYKEYLKEAKKHREKVDDERCRRNERDWLKAMERLERASKKLHVNHNDYILSIEAVNTYQMHYQQNVMTKLLNTIQQLEESSVIPLKEVFFEIQSNTSWCREEFLTSEKELKQSIELINSKEEYLLFSNSFKRHPTAVIPYFFEDNLLEDPDITRGLSKEELSINNFTIPQLRDRKKILEDEKSTYETKLKVKLDCFEEQKKKLQEIRNTSHDEIRSHLSMIEQLIKFHNLDLELKEISCKIDMNRIQYEIIVNALSEVGNREPKYSFDIEQPSFDTPIKLPKKDATSAISKPNLSTFPNMLKRGRSSLRSRSSSCQAVVSSTGSTSSVEPNEYDSDVSYEDPYETLFDSTWYHGRIDRSTVRSLLKNDGDFMVREKSDGSGDQVLSVLWQGHTKHFILKPDEQGMFRLEGDGFRTIPALINHHHSKKIVLQSSTGIILVNPIIRHSQYSYRHADVRCDYKLGSGNFGDVYKGQLKSKQLKVAIKTCKKQVDIAVKNKFIAEAEIMKSCNHDNVIKLIGICHDAEPYYILLELCEKGDLLKLLRNEGKFFYLNRLKSMCKDIADGMSYLESLQIIHRDLAARNCLVTLEYQVKISDFGMSRQEDDDSVYKMVETKEIPFKWCAPEVWEYKRCSTKSDVWAFGVVLWEVFSLGTQPYPGLTNKEAREKIDTGYRMPAPAGTPPKFYEIMESCWQHYEDDRPSFKDITKEIDSAMKVT